jgi:YHS domain-containing protein
MRRSFVALVALALMTTAAFGALAGDQCGDRSAASSECSPGSVASRFVKTGKVLGRFDPAMSGVCRFGCATRIKYDAKDVIAQPGAKAGKLTQCPVSGVVFAVDGARPRIRYGKDEYVTCCDKCASKFRRDPRHYVRA